MVFSLCLRVIYELELYKFIYQFPENPRNANNIFSTRSFIKMIIQFYNYTITYVLNDLWLLYFDYLAFFITHIFSHMTYLFFVISSEVDRNEMRQHIKFKLYGTWKILFLFEIRFYYQLNSLISTCKYFRMSYWVASGMSDS